MKVILSPRAEVDFEAQVAWLKQHSPTASETRITILRIFHSRQNR